MKLIARLLLASALLSGSAALATVGTAFAAAPSHATITVSCTDGYSRTVSAHAAHGIATSLTKFSRFTHSGVICTAFRPQSDVAAEGFDSRWRNSRFAQQEQDGDRGTRIS